MRVHRPGRTAAIAIGLWLGVVVVGILMATIGNVLRDPLCVGGGSECAGAKAPAQRVGTALYFLGTGIAFASPVIVAAGFALRKRWRSSAKA